MNEASALAPADALRLMVFDRTCRGKSLRPGLSHAWWSGAHLYHALGRIDAFQGVDSWEQAFDWLATYRPDRPIAEVQYWGHGKWGHARVGAQVFDIEGLQREHSFQAPLRRVAARMLPGAQGLWWFRTCETFGARPGIRFARALADFLGCRTAGHTYIIGHWQSGLHTMLPGGDAYWSDEEGLREGTPEDPKAAFWSRSWRPHTINFLQGAIPPGY
jgi:hypothetical protein